MLAKALHGMHRNNKDKNRYDLIRWRRPPCSPIETAISLSSQRHRVYDGMGNGRPVPTRFR